MFKKRKKILPTNLNKIRRRIDKVERAATRQRKQILNRPTIVTKTIRYNVIVWLILVVFLILLLVFQGIFYNYNNQTESPRSGGTYAEGIVGDITSFNPLYVKTNDEKALSSLVYSSLLKTDETNNISLDIASSWKANNDGQNYSIKIRDDAYFHNSDKPVTVDDVLFTTKLIQDPLVQSPLYETWKNIEVKKISNDEIRFSLRTPLATFPWALNFGILSKDELKDIDHRQLREHMTDNIVTGSGPFMFHNISQSGAKNKILYFTPNLYYYDGAPQVDAFHVETYSTSADLISGFRDGEINIASDIGLNEAQSINGKELHSTPINSGVFAIFNNERRNIKNSNVRQALRLALNRDEIRQNAAVNGQPPNVLETPIAPGTFNKIDKLSQPSYNTSEANRLLSSDGWQYNNDFKYVKNLSPLEINIVTVKDSDYVKVAEEIADQWNEFGVDTKITLADADNIQQNFIMPRNYDVLLYRLELGGDSDVFSYWSSSKAKEQGLNLANYKSAAADLQLARARTQINNKERENTYKEFVNTWINDVPAIALFQSNLYYLKNDNINAWHDNSLVDKSARFRDVNTFTVNISPVNKTP